MADISQTWEWSPSTSETNNDSNGIVFILTLWRVILDLHQKAPLIKKNDKPIIILFLVSFLYYVSSSIHARIIDENQSQKNKKTNTFTLKCVYVAKINIKTSNCINQTYERSLNNEPIRWKKANSYFIHIKVTLFCGRRLSVFNWYFLSGVSDVPVFVAFNLIFTLCLHDTCV